MQYINSAISGIFSIIIFPFRSLDPMWSLAVFSLLIGILMLIIFRYTSNQNRIRETKRKIRAHIFELSLYKDELGIVLRAQKDILIQNLKYMKYALVPMAFMIIPLGLILIQLDSWYGYRALRPDETAIVSMRIFEGKAKTSEVSLKSEGGITIETPPLRIPGQKRVDWRIKADTPGVHDLVFDVSGLNIRQKVTVSGGGLVQLSPAAYSKGLWNKLLNPGQEPLPPNPAVKEIKIGYPAATLDVMGFKLHWLVVVFILSIVFGFALKGLFRVEI